MTLGVRKIVDENLVMSRTILIFGEINQDIAEKVCGQLIVLQEISNDPIVIYINSEGGHVEAADTIHDMIKFISPKVYIIGTGWVANNRAILWSNYFNP